MPLAYSIHPVLPRALTLLTKTLAFKDVHAMDIAYQSDNLYAATTCGAVPSYMRDMYGFVPGFNVSGDVLTFNASSARDLAAQSAIVQEMIDSGADAVIICRCVRPLQIRVGWVRKVSY